jgi:hypothetical protein
MGGQDSLEDFNNDDNLDEQYLESEFRDLNNEDNEVNDSDQN